MISVGRALGFALLPVASWTQIQPLLGHFSVQTTERDLWCKQRIQSPVNDRIGIRPSP